MTTSPSSSSAPCRPAVRPPAEPRTAWPGEITGTGEVGAGLVQPPQECFEKAVAALAEESRRWQSGTPDRRSP
jgi:hypothetical protein